VETGAAVAESASAVRATQLRQARRNENFPVALRLLPASRRADLVAVYDVARTIDDIGDDPAATPAQRLAALDRLDAELAALPGAGPGAAGPGAAGPAPGADPATAAVAALAPVLRRHQLSVDPFRALVQANRLDQTHARWASWDELRAYCRLSADPIGRIVLAVFDASTPERVAWSDQVCTALQVLEHCQDVAEDLHDRDRVYLPADELAAAGVTADDLAPGPTPVAVRAVVRAQVDRAVGLLATGRPLVRSLRGWARVAVAGYVAGGLATADAIRRVDHAVLAGPPRPRGRDIARHALRLAVGRRS